MSSLPATKRHWICFGLSVILGIGYGVAYWDCRIGTSPFHISSRLPGLDWLILAVAVVAPLATGIALGLCSGRLKWWALSLYVIVVPLSLI